MTRPGTDTVGMWELTMGLPEQVAAAAKALSGGIAGLPAHDDVGHVVVVGMGGSGIGGDVVAAVAGPFLPVPVLVVKEYELPGCVGPESLVLAVSVSGNTEETVEAAAEAAAAGAHVVVVCSGGALEREARSWGAPVLPVPRDIPMPRAALGAVTVPLLVTLEEVGLFPGARGWIADAVAQLERRRDELAGPAGAWAEDLAGELAGRVPVVHGGGAIGAAAAVRWKGQCNENAKVPAFAGRLPELCHNELQGTGPLDGRTRELLALVQLRHDHEHPQVARRFDLVREPLAAAYASVHEVAAAGDGPLAQLLDLALQGDVVSLHLAGALGVDPGPIPALEALKAALSA
jgi:glucose/mannose-6-phosphate isomerase